MGVSRGARGSPLSHHLNYLWPDLKKQSKAPKRILGGAEELENAETVVFYDDNVGSAGQSKTVLQQWFGLPRKAWYVDEEHVQPLQKKKLQILTKATLKFLFVTGRRKGLEELLSTARDLCGHSSVEGHIIAPADLSCFQPAAGVFADTATAQKAREAFERAGRRALADKRELWKQEKLEDRLLGYGNFGGLTVFYYNVPTATLTALWKSSPVSGSEWLGLFPRRPRD